MPKAYGPQIVGGSFTRTGRDVRPKQSRDTYWLKSRWGQEDCSNPTVNPKYQHGDGSNRPRCQVISFFTSYYNHLFPDSLAWTKMVICSRHTPTGVNFGGLSALSHGERHGKRMDV